MSGMQDVIQIPQLPTVAALNGTEQMEAVQAGTSVQITTQQIANYSQAQPAVPFSSLPAAAGNTGLRRFINNCSTTTFHAVADGAGSSNVPVFSDGSVWRVG